MKINAGAVIFGVGVLLVIANIAYAGEYHHSEPLAPSNITNNYNTTKTALTGQSKGIATAIAIGQHQFDASTFAWQGSISTGSYDDSSAFSFALAKRFKATLISGSVANEGGKIGYGASLGFKF